MTKYACILKAKGDGHADCCDTPAYCSSVRRCTRQDTPKPAGGDAVAWLYMYEHDGESDHCLSCAPFADSWVAHKGATVTPLYTTSQGEQEAGTCRGPGICAACSRAAGCCFKGERCGRTDCPAPIPGYFRKPGPCPNANPSACEVGALVARWRAEALKLRESAGRASKRGRFGLSSPVASLELTQAAQDVDAYADELEAALQHRGDSRGGEAK